MAWIYLAESAESQKLWSRGSEQLPTVKESQLLSEFYSLEWPDMNWMLRPSGMTLTRCGGGYYRESISFPEDFLVKTSVLPDLARAWQGSEVGYFLKSLGSLAKFDLNSFSWKTSQLSLFEVSTGLDWSSLRWGTIVDGQLYQPKQLEPITGGSGGSYLPTPTATEYGNNQSNSKNAAVRMSLNSMAKKNLWPTPLASDTHPENPSTAKARMVRRKAKGQKTGGANGSLSAQVMKWPTPAAQDSKNLTLPISQMDRDSIPGAILRTGQESGGQLNPTWVEWLMGYRLGTTESEPWATAWFRSKSKRPLKN